MNLWKRIAIIGGTLLVVTGPTLAQTAPGAAAPTAPGKQANGRGRQIALAIVPVAVIDMLTPLKDEQKTKITGIQDKFNADSKAATGDKTKVAELSKQASEEVKAVLTSDQVNTVQTATPALTMLNRAKIPLAALPEIKVTREQMDKIVALASEEAGKLKGLKGEERRTKNTEVTTDFKTRVDGIFTTEQKDALAKYETEHKRGKKASA